MKENSQNTPIYSKTSYFFRKGKGTVYFNMVAYKTTEKMEAQAVGKEQLKQDLAKIGRREAAKIRLQEKSWFKKRKCQNGRVRRIG